MTPCGSRYGQMPRTAAARCPREPASADSVSLPRARRGREATPPRALIRPAPRSPHARERVAPRSALADRPGTTPTQIRPQLTGHHRTSSGASSTPESAEASAHNGGRRAVIHAGHAPLASGLRAQQMVSRSEYLCIGALGPVVRFCRGQGQAPRGQRKTSATPTWSVGSRERCQPSTEAGGNPSLRAT
jgi:hypothetical protein